ncbi:hypothetical protein, partial [Micromonospora sp. WMMB482]|uniref:hypothetical protein n=1 Tax=Micromonospora sp. WMMB482 TaxID=2849653 RepID=UPI0020B27967
MRVDVLRKRTVVGDLGEAQCPPEGAASHRLREAGRIRVHVRSRPGSLRAGRAGDWCASLVTPTATIRNNSLAGARFRQP